MGRYGQSCTLQLLTFFSSVLLLVWLGVSSVAAAQMPVSKELKVKAAFLVNFTKFIVWPEEIYGEYHTLKLCLFNSTHLRNVLSEAADIGLGGKNSLVAVPRTLDQVEQCHLLFVSREEKKIIPEFYRDWGRKPILLVTEEKGGGMIDLEVADNRTQFNIDLRRAKQAGLEISSHLLKLAIKVKR